MDELGAEKPEDEGSSVSTERADEWVKSLKPQLDEVAAEVEEDGQEEEGEEPEDILDMEVDGE